MTSFGNFQFPEVLTFFAVLVRTSVVISVIPFFGDRTIPNTIRLFFCLALALVLYPTLLGQGTIQNQDAEIWGKSTWSLVSTIGSEILLALAFGFVARFAFEAIQLGGNLIGVYMGYAAASQFDPHQETQTQLIGQFHFVIGMLVFMALDGHHLFIQALVKSYQIVGIGRSTVFSGVTAHHLMNQTANLIVSGAMLSAPLAIAITSVNVVFGVLGKAMPQMNILVLSFGVSSILGFAFMFFGMPAFESAVRDSFASAPDQWFDILKSMVGK